MSRGRLVPLILALGSLAAPLPAADGELWTALLAAHARDGGFDYAALARDRDRLDEYLAWVAAASPEGWNAPDRLAFWINAYNAAVAGLVLDRYPEITSVREVDGFFDSLRVAVAGTTMTLDEIEGAARALGDARVHFAVVCASTSCPDLRAEAYVGDRLDAQLEDQTRRFLADPRKGLRFDAAAGELHVSSIFKWYAGDFTGGSTVVAFFARSRVSAWILEHLPAGLASQIREADPAVRYLDYDWSLNDR